MLLPYIRKKINLLFHSRDTIPWNIQKRIQVYNFWPQKEYWLVKFIEKRDIQLTRNIHFYSVFGDRNLVKWDWNNNIRIFFNCENPYGHIRGYENHLLGNVNLSLGFEKNLLSNDYINFPLWILYIFAPESSLEDIQKKISEIEKIKFNIDFYNRKFCSLVSSHDNNGVRMKCYNTLKSISNIDCAGKLNNNTDELKTLYNDNKIAFISNYKFNICIENSNRKGYTTEKIFEALVAGCLPIYWGSEGEVESEVLNQSRIIFFDPEQPEKCKNKITDLTNTERLSEFYKQPIFSPNAALWIYSKFKHFENALKSMMEK